MTYKNPNKYELTRLGTDMNGKYGHCEVCVRPVDEHYRLSKDVKYYSKILKRDSTYHVGSIYGHKNCLENQMKPFDDSLLL